MMGGKLKSKPTNLEEYLQTIETNYPLANSQTQNIFIH